MDQIIDYIKRLSEFCSILLPIFGLVIILHLSGYIKEKSNFYKKLNSWMDELLDALNNDN